MRTGQARRLPGPLLRRIGAGPPAAHAGLRGDAWNGVGDMRSCWPACRGVLPALRAHVPGWCADLRQWATWLAMLLAFIRKCADALITVAVHCGNRLQDNWALLRERPLDGRARHSGQPAT